MRCKDARSRPATASLGVETIKASQAEFDGTVEKLTRAIACPVLCLQTTPVAETLKHMVSLYTDFIWAIMRPLALGQFLLLPGLIPCSSDFRSVL